jgi:hypothetical protein
MESLKNRASECRRQAEELTNEANTIDQVLGLGNVESVLKLLGGTPVEATIAKTVGRKPGKPGRKPTTKSAKGTAHRGPRGPRSQPSLRSLILDVLQNKNEGLTLAEIVQEILKKGYKSSAENFSIVVYQNLYQLSKKSEVGHKDHKYSLTKAA